MRKFFDTILFFPSLTRARIVGLLAITLAATVFEGFGVAMLFPVMDFIEKGRDFQSLAATSSMWFYLDQGFGLLGIPKTLVALMCAVLCLFMVRQVFSYLKNTQSRWVTERILTDIRSTGFESFVQADIAFFDGHSVGQLVNALVVDGVRAGTGVFSFFTLLSACLVFALYLFFLMLLSPGMTLCAIVIMGCVALVLKPRIAESGEVGKRVSEYNERTSNSIVERLNGMRLIKLSGTEQREADHVGSLSEEIMQNSYHIIRIRAKTEVLVDPIVILAGLAVLYFSVEVFKMTLGETGVFIFVLLRLLPYTKEIFGSRQALAGCWGSLLRVKDLLDEARKARLIRGGPVTEVKVEKGIRFEQVSFSYSDRDSSVLKDVNLFVPAGRMTALVGRSGAGKSTLVDLIPRLRVPKTGRIWIDDIPSENFELGSLRRSIAFVSQDGFLFNDSIENNIKYCRREAASEEVVEAAKLSYADGFIRQMAEGYKTVVGEKGVRLSGGQRQRIILARALLQKANIVVLDEPTSSLDSESERYIQQALTEIRAMGKTTLIVIAHRLSTIKSADQIIVMDEGKVIESGSHGELVHDDLWYANMVRMQTVG